MRVSLCVLVLPPVSPLLFDVPSFHACDLALFNLGGSFSWRHDLFRPSFEVHASLLHRCVFTTKPTAHNSVLHLLKSHSLLPPCSYFAAAAAVVVLLVDVVEELSYLSYVIIL